MFKTKLIFLICLNFILLPALFAQTTFQSAASQPPVIQFPADDLRSISQSIAKISQSLDNLNARMTSFSQTFSSNQGLKLDDKQKRILFAFEILNRSEQRLVNLQTLKLTLTDKLTALRLQLSRNTDNLLSESVDRYVATRSTLNAEQLREIRRQALNKERSDITGLISDSENSLRQTNDEIRQTELFLIGIRQKIFPAIEKELSDF